MNTAKRNYRFKSELGSIPTPCSQCAFLGLHPWEGPGAGDCAFGIWNGALSSARIPADCPRELRLSSYPRTVGNGDDPKYIHSSRMGGSHPRGRPSRTIRSPKRGGYPNRYHRGDTR